MIKKLRHNTLMGSTVGLLAKDTQATHIQHLLYRYLRYLKIRSGIKRNEYVIRIVKWVENSYKEYIYHFLIYSFLCFDKKHLYLLMSVGWSVGLQNILIFLTKTTGLG